MRDDPLDSVAWLLELSRMTTLLKESIVDSGSMAVVLGVLEGGPQTVVQRHGPCALWLNAVEENDSVIA